MDTQSTTMTTTTTTNEEKRQAARDAGRERARLAAALGATKGRKDEVKARIAPQLDGLKGKALSTKTRELVAADRDATFESVDGSQVTVTLKLKRDSDGKLTNRCTVDDILVGHDVTGAPIRLAVTGSLRITDTVRVTVDSLVQ